MTTPKGADTTGGAAAAEPRVRRPQPDASGPNRSGGPRRSERAAEAVSPHGPVEASINEQVAQAVRAGYDVIAENISLGRAAAERFRLGDYNIREVPGDVETVLLRLLQLARELSTTSLDVCEKLVREIGGQAGGAPPAAQGVPPFRAPPTEPAAAPGAPMSPMQPQMKVTVRFEGSTTAVARTQTLNRPQEPTFAQDIVVTPLSTRDPGAPAISGVRFQTDVSVEGLIAVVSVPPGLPPGVYSGLVRAPTGDLPLGMLAVEIP